MSRDILDIQASPVETMTDEEWREYEALEPDVVLISDYLAKSLPPDERAEVERRLREDSAFCVSVAPIMEMWRSVADGARFSETPEQIEAGWRRFYEKLREGDERQDGGDANATSAQPTRRALRRWQLAAMLLFAAFVVIAVWAGGMAWRKRTEPTVSMAVAPAGDNTIVRLSSGSLVTLQPGSRLTWAAKPDSSGMHTLYLDGSADFTLEPLQSGAYVVVTPSARMLVNGTALFVESPDPSTTLVTMREGHVLVTPRGATTSQGLVLYAGEKGLFLWGRQPRRAQ